MKIAGSNSKKELRLKRIKYETQGHLMLSRIFSDERKVVRLVLNTEVMTYAVVDALTGHVYKSGGDGINNFEVLQRHAKRALENFLDANFLVEIKKKPKAGE